MLDEKTIATQKGVAIIENGKKIGEQQRSKLEVYLG
jgi:hypothetical protein